MSEASDLLQKEDSAKIIAGGQSMMPLLRQDIVSPSALVDITQIKDLQGVSISVEDKTVSIGSLVTYQELLEHEICQELGLLRDAVDAVGDVQVRNAGTIGGGVAHADPAQDFPPALQCYEADVIVANGGEEQKYDINEFFIDFYFTEMAPHEILTRIEFTRPPSTSGGAFAKHARTPGGFSEAGIAAHLVPGEDGFRKVRLAYCAGAPVPRRVPAAVENQLEGGELTPGRVAEAAEGIVDSLDNIGDVGEYDEDYNDHIFRVLTKRALTTAAKRSTGPEVVT